jgi:hypothetical protein
MLDLSTLTKYVDENSSDLVYKAIMGANTLNYTWLEPGIKHSKALNIIGSDLVAQAGGCGWGASGSTALTQRVIVVDPIKINESICIQDLNEYWLGMMLNKGSYNETLPQEAIFAAEKVEAITWLLEQQIWQGDTLHGTGNLALNTGFVTLFDAGITASSDNYATYSKTGFASNPISIIDGFIDDLPMGVYNNPDAYVYMSKSNYLKYCLALRDKNYYHYSNNDGAEYQLHPGTTIKVVGLDGLNGVDRIAISNKSNMIIGTDLLTDSSSFKIWYSQDNNELRFACHYKLGTQVRFLENVLWAVGS